MAESSDFSPMKTSEATISDRLFGTVKPTSNGHVTVVEEVVLYLRNVHQDDKSEERLPLLEVRLYSRGRNYRFLCSRVITRLDELGKTLIKAKFCKDLTFSNTL